MCACPTDCLVVIPEQERSGCKLQMIQDGEYLTAPQKPLKIIGDREACQVRNCVMNGALR